MESYTIVTFFAQKKGFKYFCCMLLMEVYKMTEQQDKIKIENKKIK